MIVTHSLTLPCADLGPQVVDSGELGSSNRSVAENSKNDAAPPGADTATPASGEAPEEFDAVAAAAEFEAALHSTDGGSQLASTEEYARMLESEVESISSMLAQKEVVAQRAMARADQAVEEIEESKQRLQLEMSRELERRVREVLRVFLEVLDDLDRAIDSARAMDHNPDVVAGVELVRKSFLGRLGGFGVEHLPAQGQAFDPEVHEAVSTRVVQAPEEDGRVVAVVREGYSIAGETLRPAMVVVGKLGK